jgi:hypothetical protein
MLIFFDLFASVLVIINTLSHRALHDISNEVRVEATSALVLVSESITASMPQHQIILDTFTHLASSPTAVPEVVAAALKKQASHPGNRSSMGERKMLLESVARIALSLDSTTAGKEDACNVIFSLSELESNRRIIATCSVLEALVQNSIGRFGEQNTRQTLAIRALVNLASIPSNRKAMLTHNQLLQTLLQYASTSPSNETKTDVKKVILLLVSEL